MVVTCVCICMYVYVGNILVGSTVVSCRGMFFRDTVHLLMTITKLRSEAFGPGCHQLATSTAIYASPCRHRPEGSCGSGWCNKASRVSPRQTYCSARESDCAVRRELCFGKKTLKEPIIQTHNFEFWTAQRTEASFSLRNFFQLIPNFPFN